MDTVLGCGCRIIPESTVEVLGFVLFGYTTSARFPMGFNEVVPLAVGDYSILGLVALVFTEGEVVLSGLDADVWLPCKSIDNLKRTKPHFLTS